MKDFHSNALDRINVLNQKLEENDKVISNNKILTIKIKIKDKEFAAILMKYKHFFYFCVKRNGP